MGSHKHPYLSRLLTILLSTVAPAGYAVAQNYGKVGAVNPDATGAEPAGGTKELTVGGNIIRKERIVTSAKGSTQILFPDQSTLNVGANSNIVIDEFIYDPNARTGKMVASATKGVLRYIGGQISHTAGATINTPVATLGIRGGIVTLLLPVPASLAATDPNLAHARGRMLVIASFGTITLTNASGSTTLRPGFAIIVGSPGQPFGHPFRPSDAFLQHVMHSLTSSPGQRGGIGNARIPTDSRIIRLGIGTPNNTPPGRPSGSNPPGSDPLGYTTIFGGGNSAARGHAQSAPPYP
jgi:hypothetical protein